MGRDGPLYEIAQWYPRMAVYDDVRGWNHEPYIGAGEFYLEYGDFDVSLTVPASYIVSATGTLQNAAQVLTAAQRARLATARHSDSAVAIITAPSRGTPIARGRAIIRTPGTSPRTTCATSRGPRHPIGSGKPATTTASSSRRCIVPPPDQWAGGEAHRMARGAIQYFSEQWYRYPWPHATTVEGPVGGMEYPMLTFVPNGSSRETSSGSSRTSSVTSGSR